MEKIILPKNRDENPENISEVIDESIFKKFFLEVASITIFTWHFFKEYLNRRMNLMSCSSNLF